MRAAIYTRVSTSEQANGYSLPKQLEACLRHIKANGWEFVGEYVDAGESAWKNGLKRPQLTALRENLSNIDVMVCYEIDRFCRNRRDYYNLKHEFQEAGVKMVFLQEDFADDSSGIIVESFHIGRSETESVKTSERVEDNMAHIARKGRKPGKAPIGYLNYRAESTTGRGEASIIVDEKISPLVVEAFELYASGDYSLSELCAYFNRKGLRNSRGNDMQIESMRRTLHNTFYYGWCDWGDVSEPGTQEPLVTKELWDTVQKNLDDKNQRGSSPWKHNHYLKGLFRCVCGRKMGFTEVKGYEYYVCRNKACEEKYVRSEGLEEDVTRLYEEISLPQEMQDEIEQGLETAIAEQESRRAGSVKRLSNNLSALSSQRNKLLALYYADALDIQSFKAERERIDEQTRSAERELEQANASLGEERGKIDVALRLLDAMHESYRRASPEVRRKYNLAFLEHVIVGGRHVQEAKLNEPFRSLMERPVRTSNITWS